MTLEQYLQDANLFYTFNAYFSLRKSNHLSDYELRRNCLSVFDHFVGLVIKGLKALN